MADPSRPPTPDYYRPYLASDSELSDADSDGETGSYFSRPSVPRPGNANQDYVDSRQPSPDYKLLAEALNQPLTLPAGPSFVTTKQEDFYASRRLDPRTSYHTYKAPTRAELEAQLAHESTITAETTSNVQTVIMLQSRNRDKTVFPVPTQCQLFLPRDYKRVVGFSIAQINLTSAFFYFSELKNNVAIQLYEQNQIVYNCNSQPLLTPSGDFTPRYETNYIRDGSYNIQQLLNELTIQLNKVPLFYDFINGFSDFLPLFQVNGDYSLNFNYPGDYYYDATNKIYIQNPTRAQITSYYFQSQFANLFTYTIQQVRVAYYYPVIKEALLDPDTVTTELNLSGTGLSAADTINYLLYQFQGINDPIATIVINNNIPWLDNYRLRHTFRYSLVNKYICSYNATNNRVSITTPSLNTSLVNLLNAQYNTYLTQQLAKYQISAAQFATLAAQNTQILSILQAMYDYLQVQLAVYFAINYGTFSRAYYANSNNTILLRNGLDASGIAIRYDPNVAPTPRDTNLIEDFRTNPPYYWPRMSNLTNIEGARRNMGRTSVPYPLSSNFPYNLSVSNIDLTRNFIDNTGTIYTDVRTKAGDILVDVDAGKYTIFQFRSKYRQTLQVETLPRQTAFRYPEWNKANPVAYPIDTLFDASYCYVNPGAAISNVTPFDISYNEIQGWVSNSSTLNFGIGYDDSLSYWQPSKKEELTVVNSNGKFYTFKTPLPVWPKGSNEYVYNLSLTLTTPTGAPFASQLLAFFYHDIGAFSADLSQPRNENPIHYKAVFSTIQDVGEIRYDFTAYADQQYYLLVRAASPTPSLTQYRIVPWFPNIDPQSFSTLSTSTTFNPLQDPTTMLDNLTVAKVADPNYIRMPVLPSTLWGSNPTDAVINQTLSAVPVPIGYDQSNVSNDLTDYVPFAAFSNTSSILPTATIRADPINNYLFQYASPYSQITDSYFYSGSSNALLLPLAQAQYTPGTVEARQYKIVNWYSPNYIYTAASNMTNDITPYAQAYTSSTTQTPLFGYSYTGSNAALRLGTGVSGFMFLPTDGTWAVDRITFKANFTNSNVANSNNNKYIHALGVFYTSEITARATSYINLSNALAICLRTNIRYYSSNPDLNLGFDAQFGSYYSFTNYSTLVTIPASNSIISGFAQNSKTFITDSNAYYSVVAFRFPAFANCNWDVNTIGLCNIHSQLANAEVVQIQNLMGSPIAYPYANQAQSALTFYDGKFSPTGQGVVRSTSNGNNTIYGPPVGADESISQYEQSIPIVNTNIHYLNPTNIIADLNGFAPWSNLPTVPAAVYPSISNYMLIQDTAFTLCYYSTYTTVTTITPPARDFIVRGQFTADAVYPYYENTSLIAVSGNTYEYCFLGASNNPLTPGQSQLRFKVYSIATGLIQELPINPAYTFCNAYQLQRFVYTDSRAWFITSAEYATKQIILQGDQQYNSTVTVTNILKYTSSIYSELSMDPQGSNLYFAAAPLDSYGFSTMTLWTFNSNDTVGRISTTNGYTINLNTSGTLPPYYRQFAVSLNDSTEELLLTNVDYRPFKYYKLRNYIPLGTTSSNTTIDESIQNFRDENSNFISPTRIYGGAGGSKWVTFDESPWLMGNRNDAFDAPISLNIAWQIFFPTVKIELRKLTNGASPMVNLTNLDYPEWPHTAMFAYSNYNSMIFDISGVASGTSKWGNESKSNFWVSDVSFNGFYFNSYIMNIPLLPNTSANYLTNYYLAVRGWLPTEKFQMMMRFYVPNRYDFGFARIGDVEDEVFLALSTPSEFNPTYLNTLTLFNSNFIFTNRNFGSNPTSGFAGSNLTSSNFKDYMTQYSGYFSTFTANTTILEQITSTVNASINTFIASDLQYVLPSTALTRQRFTDPLLFQIRWRSQLTPQFLTLEDEWGLGWNLGYAKQDTPFATIHTGESFYKIQQDFIYLRLNPEFNINRMDAGGKENYKETREPNGFVNQYYCKLLLTSFGGNATTFIHNPIQFNPSIYKLSKLEFQWVDQNGNTITNADAEWDMVVNITEQVDTVPPNRTKIKFNTNPPFTPANPRDPRPAPIDSELLADGAEELQERANQEAAILYKQERTTLEQERSRPIMMNTQTGGVRPDYPAWLPAYDARLRQQRMAVPPGATTQLDPAWKP
jgi:hypothetical protein